MIPCASCRVTPDYVVANRSPARYLSPECDDAREKFLLDFVTAWDKVVTLDRFDLA